MEFSYVILGFILITSHSFTVSADPATPALTTTTNVAPTATGKASTDSTQNVTAGTPAGSTISNTTTPIARTENVTYSNAEQTSTAAPTVSEGATTAGSTAANPVAASTSAPSNTTASVLTAGPTTPNSSTAARTNLTSAPSTTTTAVSAGSTAEKPTSTPGTTTPATTTPATTTFPPVIAANATISETNLLLADSDFFVELEGKPSVTLDGVTLAVFSASTNVCAQTVNFTAANKMDDAGFFVQNLTADMVKQSSVVVTLYKTSNFTGQFSSSGLLDAIIVSNSPTAVSAAVKETQHNGNSVPIVIANKEKLKAITKDAMSLSRCMDQNSFITVSVLTKGKANNCSFNISDTPVELLVKEGQKIPCGVTQSDLENIVVNITSTCQCGMTKELLADKRWNSKTMHLTAHLWGVFKVQREMFLHAYKDFMKSAPSVPLPVCQGEQLYIQLDNCTLNCALPQPAIHNPDKNSNISVTVAVVLSCIAVFIIILVAVIIYMRRKRRSILQFRMTRLNEDDDMEDMEDFVGGGTDDHEPSFNKSHLTR